MFGLTQMMTYDENQSTQRTAGVIDHARPDRSTSEGKWNSISKRSSLKNYIVESPSAEFATFPDVAACSPSVSPAAFQRSSSYSLQDQINRNQPESTRINPNQPESTGSAKTSALSSNRPFANEDPASSDCLAKHLTEICDNEVQVRQQNTYFEKCRAQVVFLCSVATSSFNASHCIQASTWSFSRSALFNLWSILWTRRTQQISDWLMQV